MWENTFNFSSGYFPDFILYPCVVKPENNDFDLDYYPEFSDGKYTKQLSNVYSKYDNHYFDRMYPIYRICKKFWKPQEISPSCRKAANSSRIGTKGEDTNTHQSKYPQNKHSSGNSINSNIATLNIVVIVRIRKRIIVIIANILMILIIVLRIVTKIAEN